MRKLLIAVAMALAVLANAGAARADYFAGKPRWYGSRICVENHAGDRWRVPTGEYSWDKAPDLYMVTKSDCSGYKQVIKVRSGYYGQTGWIGLALLSWSGGYFVSPLTIKLNNSYGYTSNCGSSCRLHVTDHELGHALGLAHTTHTRSIMRPGSYEYTVPQLYDYQQIEGLYPW